MAALDLGEVEGISSGWRALGVVNPRGSGTREARGEERRAASDTERDEADVGVDDRTAPASAYRVGEVEDDGPAGRLL